MKPKYNTWIRFRKMGIFILIFLCLLLTGFCLGNVIIKILFFAISLPFGYVSIILAASYYYFSDKGGKFQEKVHNTIVSKINDGSNVAILDIGAGSGSMSIKAAKKNNGFIVKAIDYWGNNWEYSKNQCVNNAVIEHVDKQVEFIKASASKLPFKDGAFDVVISCLTFHEVQDTSDKNLVISEAIRVLKHGGQFVFFDLFYDKNIFGDFNNFVNRVKKDGVEILEISNMKILFENCPKILLHKKVLGHGVLIIGNKL